MWAARGAPSGTTHIQRGVSPAPGPVPEGVGNISFGATIAGNRRMTIDDFGVAVGRRPTTARTTALGSRAFAATILSGFVFLPVAGAALYDRVRRAGARDRTPRRVAPKPLRGCPFAGAALYERLRRGRRCP